MNDTNGNTSHNGHPGQAGHTGHAGNAAHPGNPAGDHPGDQGVPGHQHQGHHGETGHQGHHDPHGHHPGYPQPTGHGGWQPMPQGAFDHEATAFVQLPSEDQLRAAPLEAPGHGFVPPMILPLTPVADPQIPPEARLPHDGGTAGGQLTGGWPDPAGPHSPRGAEDPHATGQWAFPDAGGQQGGPAAPSDVTGQWTIPVARGDLPEETGEYTAAMLQAQQWNGPQPSVGTEPHPETGGAAAAAPWAPSDAPATLPGGAAAPWAAPRHPHTVPVHPPHDHPSHGEPVAGHPHHGSVVPPVHPGPTGLPVSAEYAQYPEQPEHSEHPGHPEYPEHAEPAVPAVPAEHLGHPEPEPESQTGAAIGSVGSVAPPAAGSVTVPVAGHPADQAPHPAHPEQPQADGVPDGPVAPEPGPDSAAPADGAAATEDAAAVEAVTETDEAAGEAPAAPEPAPESEAGSEPEPAAAEAPEPAETPEPEPAAEPGPEPVPAPVFEEHPPTSYVLRVNGADRPVTDAWIGESLLYVLRERLGLAGAKDGCSQGECGACNVQVDGRLVASCLVPAATAAGTEVRTVEGLAEHGEPSDVQRALVRNCAVQCGFCVPGMAMTVHDLLEGNHRPTDLETRQALCGNLCRCSGYRGVLDAVREVVAEREANAAAAEAESGQHRPGTAPPGQEARIPHQAPPGAGSVQPHPHDGGMA
ncbi:2Fe-2S iron-sulfur cluster-binding protein [Streptomyces sp. NPDC020875]|uniref:(2Fe-2S)-binding protein n=1 Tax=Streptomyces sp. NPDC020875 TaxID=3154898 RepID=UPI0033C65760